MWNKIQARWSKAEENPDLVIAGLLLAVLAVTRLVTWAAAIGVEPLQAQAIDQLFRLRSSVEALRPTYDETVIHVPIDDESVRARDAYYVGRADFGRLVQNLRRAGVETMLLDVIFAAPQDAAEDRALADALESVDGAFVGMALGITEGRGPADVEVLSPEARDVLERQRWHIRSQGNAGSLLTSSGYFLTFPELAAAADGMGYLDLVPDGDGVFRRVPLLVRDGDGFLPSLALLVICSYLDVDPAAIEVVAGRRLTLFDARKPGSEQAQDISIPIDRRGAMRVNYVGPWGSMKAYPFTSIYDASDDRFEMEDLREELEGKVAVVAWFSTGRGDIGPVPTDPIFPRSGIWANVMNTILSGEFLRELSGWQMLLWVELPLIALLFFGATRLSTLRFVGVALGLVLGYVALVAGMFLFANTILALPEPVMVLVGSTVVLASFRYHLEAQARAKLHRELAVAREIQLGTLPSEMPGIAGYDLAGASEPADQTGGDSFDVISLSDQSLMLLLGDATGHGIGPALSVTQMRAMLRVAIRLKADLDSTVTHINDQLSDDLAAHRFVTAFLGILDTADHAIRYHSGGQGPLMHYHAATGEFDWLGASHMPLGMLDGIPMKAPPPIVLEPGDILGLMTDGVFEQENAGSEQFGEERVAQLVRERQHGPMSELLEAIYREVRTHRGKVAQSDDVTVLLLRRLPPTD